MANQQPQIFVSYRRQDSQGFAGRITDALVVEFGDDAVFRDDEISAGQDYMQVLTAALKTCKVLLAVIGRRWLTVTNVAGEPRLTEPEDWVRLEIEAALSRKVWVIPILVGGASMPREFELPPSLSGLSRQQAYVISDRRWGEDIQGLVSLLRTQLPSLQISARRTRETGQAVESMSTAQPLFEQLRRAFEVATRWESRQMPRQTVLGKLVTLIYRAIKRLLVLAIILIIVYFLIQHYGNAEIKGVLHAFFRYLKELLNTVLSIAKSNS